MYRTAVALLHDGDLARDIVHDVFASLLDGSPGASWSSDFPPVCPSPELHRQWESARPPYTVI